MENSANATLILGGKYGDEGKGKIASKIAEKSDLVIRATGGANAGHTVVDPATKQKIALHLVPGGIVYPHTLCLIGQGVVLDLDILFSEIKTLEELGITNLQKRLKISGRAHITFPYHKELDELHEKMKDKPVGTTKRGIGPTYSDKDNRVGLQVYDLLLPLEELENKIDVATRLHNQLFKANGMEESVVDPKVLAKEYHEYGLKLKDMVVNANQLIREARQKDWKTVVEGAQAIWLDKDYGDYPDVTSSNCCTEGTLIGAHLSYKDVKCVIVVLKAHDSRVGNGPFPTEQPAHIENDTVTEYDEEDACIGDVIRELAGEYGATTKRPRRTGWFDAAQARTALEILGADYVVLNHLDTMGKIINKLGVIGICEGYYYLGEYIQYYPDDIRLTKQMPEPVYGAVSDGWEIPKGTKKYKDLPENAKKFIRYIESLIGVPIKWVGVGPGNDDLIEVKEE